MENIMRSDVHLLVGFFGVHTFRVRLAGSVPDTQVAVVARAQRLVLCLVLPGGQGSGQRPVV